MNGLVLGLGALSALAVIGGVLNLVRLTFAAGRREKDLGGRLHPKAS